ncbi:MAG: hypothetical protein ACT6QS_04440 [Flavobacteriales bacterium]
MHTTLSRLEQEVQAWGEPSELPAEILETLPEAIQHIHRYRLFAGDLLAIPHNLIIEGDDEEYEDPFSFLDLPEQFEVFESEYREDIPAEFIPFGQLYGANDMVVLNTLKNTVHSFHITDVFDKPFLEYKLTKDSMGSLEHFVENLRMQTVCCVINPENHGEYDMWEIQNKTTLKHDFEETVFPDEQSAWDAYNDLLQEALAKGWKLHYAPRKIMLAQQK